MAISVVLLLLFFFYSSKKYLYFKALYKGPKLLKLRKTFLVILVLMDAGNYSLGVDGMSMMTVTGAIIGPGAQPAT